MAMEYIFSWILVSMEAASAVLLSSSCLEWRPRFCAVGPQIRSPKLQFVCAWLLLTGITFVFANLFQGGIWLKLAIALLLHFAYECLVWQIDWMPMLAIPTAYLTLSNALDSLTTGFYCTITGITLPQLMQSYAPFVLTAIFTKTLP